MAAKHGGATRWGVAPHSRVRVAVLAATEGELRRVEHTLSRVCSVVAVPDWHSLRAQAACTDVGLIAWPWLDVALSFAELDEFRRACCWYPLLLLTSADRDNLRLLATIRVDAVAFREADEAGLHGRLLGLRTTGAFAGALVRIREQQHLPHSLRAALIHVLEHGLAAARGGLAEDDSPMRTIRSLAHQLNMSEHHLGQLARQADVDLHGFLHWCFSLRALQLRAAGSWEHVAWQLGYSSVSGLSQQLLRTLGRRPTDLTADDIAGFFAAFARAPLECSRRR
jgi:AraC-like DNA-binding protein